MLILGRMTRVLLVSSLILAGAASGWAQSDSVDLSRLHWTSGDHLLVSFPVTVGGSYMHVSSIPFRSWSQQEVIERSADDLGLMRLNFSPKLIVTGNAWPVFQYYMAEIEIESREYISGSEGTDAGISAIDPERKYRENWGYDARILQAYVQAAGEHWALKSGLTRSHWGAGLLANDHRASEPGVFVSPFGSSRYVDQYLRAQLVSFPWSKKKRGLESYVPLSVAVAGDVTVDDSSSAWDADDLTYTAIGAVMVELPSFKTGFYVAHRVQEHGQGGTTEATAIDLTADLSLRFGKTRFRLMGEAALVVGTTDYVENVFTEGAHDIFSHGGVARLGVQHGVVEGVVEAGWASGDDNPYDKTIRSFSFNSGYRVGALMFNEVLRTSAAASAMNIADPALRDEVPRALDRITHRGVIREALYVNPRLAIRPLPELYVMAGFLYGRSFGEYTDPFWSSLVGGVSAGPNGALKQSELGYEVDVAVRYGFTLDYLKLALRGEFAYFVPGDVFDSPSGEKQADVFGVGLYLEAQL